MKRASTTGAAVALALLLAGCAIPAPPSDDPTTGQPAAEPVLTQPLNPPTAPEVLEYCPLEEAEHFDGEVEAVEEIYVCTVEQDVPGGTGPRTELVQRVIGGREELLAAYSQPNAPATRGACIEIAPDPLIVWLHTAGGINPVYAPVDECGFPKLSAENAFQAAELETVLEVEVPADEE